MTQAVNILKGVLGFSDQPLSEPPSLGRRSPATMSAKPPGANTGCRQPTDGDPYLPDVVQAGEQQSLLGPNQGDQELGPAAWSDEDLLAEESALNECRKRLWTFPAHIADQEAASLTSLFPKSISRKKDVRLPYVGPGHGAISNDSVNNDWLVVYVGDSILRVPNPNVEEKEGVLRHGTGRIWSGTETRSEQWKGSLWFRFVRWWLRLFGMG